ncbi:MAG TPA: DUF2892 domain-containing protein [Gammaproteobacteria bacterium]|nr:DUF2892 domain-containing protein [Gammaproteobacteria bacterium]
MKTNMGTIDRALRIIVGLVLIGLALSGTVGWWGWLGVIPVFTGALGSCPLYSIIGVNTCGSKSCDKK